MKFKTKKINLLFLALLLILTLAGCKDKKNVDENSNPTTTLNAGFSESKFTSDGKNYILIGVNGDNLKLEVLDKDMFDSLVEDEFYLFSYYGNYILKDIQRDDYLKNLVLNSMKEGNNHVYEEILASDKISLDGLNLLDKYTMDLEEDGFSEEISMYTDAELDSNGEIMWDDGQRWVLLVHGDGKDYVLFDDYIQLGSLRFNVYTVNDDIFITTINVATANFSLSQYRYSRLNNSFVKTIPYKTEGNVNMLHNPKGF